MKNRFLKILLLFVFAFTMVSCDRGGETSTTTNTTISSTTTTTTTTTERVLNSLEQKLYFIYELVLDTNSFNGTFDEWITSTSAPTDDSKEVDFIFENGMLSWRYSNDLQWQPLVSIENLTGITGTIDNYYIDGSDDLIIVYSNSSQVNLGNIELYFSVSFLDKDGALIELQLIEYGSSAIEPMAPSVEGYSFSGWSISFNSINTNLEVRAEYTVNNYTISYEVNSGSLINDVTYQYGETTQAPTEPSRDGYQFGGWYEESSLTNLYTFTTMPSNDVTLYAKWNPNQYTINFEENGGSLVTSITQDFESVVSEPTEPTRQGYTFNGWFIDASLLNEYTFDKMPLDGITLYAKWSPNQYTVTYELNNGDLPNIVTEYADSELLEPTREGYTFDGWYTDALLTQVYSRTAYPLEDMTLYASWTINQYTITYVVPSLGDDQGETISLFKDEVIIDIAIGGEHNIILTSLGRIFTYGTNQHYQLGDGTTFNSHTPIDITGFFNLNENEIIIEVYAGWGHSLVLTSQGRIFGWGANDEGQLGAGDSLDHLTSIQDITPSLNLDIDETIKSVNSDYDTTVIITSNNRVILFGVYGLDSNNYTSSDFSTHYTLSVGETIESVYINDGALAVVTSNNRVLVSGYNENGQLGDGSNVNKPNPIDITDKFTLSVGETIIKIDSQFNHGVLLTSFGRVYTWGTNSNGQLGNGTTEDSFNPIEITSFFNLSGSKIIDIYAGYDLTTALTNDGKVYTFGNANYGQLGDGQVGVETVDVLLPTEVTYNFDLEQAEVITSIVTNDLLTHLITSNNNVYTFGYMFFVTGELRYVVYPNPEQLKVKEAIIDSVVTYDYSETINDYIVSRTGYVFAGWYLEPTFTTLFIDTEMPAHDIVLYANFTKIDYAIEYNYPDALTAENPLTYNIETEDIIFNVPTKDGYIFKWYDNASFTGEPVTQLLKGSTGAVILYGTWELIDYTITYSLGVNGDNNVSNPITYNIESATITLLDPTRPGYTFDYWTHAGVITEIPTGSTGDMTITANWSPITYNISYNLDGGDNSIHNPDTYDPNTFDFSFFEPTKENYSFGGWFDNPSFTGSQVTGVERYDYGDITLYANWIPDEYSITYNIYGGELDEFAPQSYEYNILLTLPTPLRTGYTFLGWYDNPSFSGSPITEIEVGSIGDRTYYAKWETTLYTITLHTNGGVAPVNAPANYTIEDFNTSIGVPTRTGYTFDGWYQNSELTGETLNIIPEGSYGDVELYAKWVIKTYTITYDLDGATENDNPLSYTIVDTPITFNNPVKEGYTFGGFYTNNTFTSAQVTEIPAGSNTNYHLYAKWTLTEYTITYNLDGGANNLLNPSSYNMNSSLIVFEEAIRQGYIFDGWYYNPGFTGDVVEYIFAGSTGNVTLYAKWTAIEYTIDYLIMDDTYTSGEVIFLPGETIIQQEVSTFHSALLTSEGRMLTWGDNSSGQLGDNSTVDRWTPVDITDNFSLVDGETIIYIALGPDNSAAITSNGRVFVWGSYSNYVLGDMTAYFSNADQLIPLDITSNFSTNTNETITKIVLEDKHAAALSSDGRYFYWGQRNATPVGSSVRYEPGGSISALLGLNANEYIIDIAISRFNSAIITSEGRLLVWGYNDFGQLGNGTNTYENDPIDITSNLSLSQGETIEGISLGLYHMGLFTSDNRILTWGYNSSGQLGNGTNTQTNLPIDITSFFTFDTGELITQIDFAYTRSSLITSLGSIYLWGSNNSGCIGDGTTVDKNIPTEITSQFTLGADYITMISIHAYHSSAVTFDGLLFMWGNNVEGQLGDNTDVNKNTPIEITFYIATLDSHVVHVYNDILDYVPTNPGYTFDGWYTDPECTVPFTLTNMPEDNLVVYGKWVENS